MAQASSEGRPLVAESSTAESTNVAVVLQDMKDKTLTIPDYQRDSDQWDDETKSLLIESVINNLTIPAFFFEVFIDEDGIERNQVVDGQQRLTTLREYSLNKFRLVSSDDAPYLTPNSVHYAGKTLDELPETYRLAFNKYRLTVIKLRQLNGTRLEVFRRINQGGTPLSGQDIRLAVFDSKSVTYIRLAGIVDGSRPASVRFLESAKSRFGQNLPWSNSSAMANWRSWWEEKEIARGQKASETFLWALVAAQPQKLNQLLTNEGALKVLKINFSRAIDEALDAYCAQVKYQDKNPSEPSLLMSYDEMAGKFFPEFESWLDAILGRWGTSLPVAKHRIVATVIGAAYAAGASSSSVSNPAAGKIVEFIRRPVDTAKKLGIDWPVSKGKWDGEKGHQRQLEKAQEVLVKLL